MSSVEKNKTSEPEVSEPKSDHIDKTERQEADSGTGTINLKYLMDRPPKPPFPWALVFFISLFLGLIGLGGWMVFQKTAQRNVVIHRVSQGETLRDIALHYYKSPHAWRKIFLANRKKLMKQKKLQVGDTLIIPMEDDRKK